MKEGRRMETNSYRALSKQESQRYLRQTIIPGIGEGGQQKIKAAKVFLAGLGGLGSISATYLAAAGIGHLVIVDMDEVRLDNLNRQIIHWTEDIGKPKVDSTSKLRRLNPLCHIQPVHAEIREDNIMDLVGDCSIIVDATDNLATRKVLNRASLSKRIPFIYGGIDGFNGMVSTFVPGKSPCLECIFPSLPPQGKVFGVLGPVPGWVASIQSMEVLKIILGMTAGLLMGRLFILKGAEMRVTELEIARNTECEVCSRLFPPPPGKRDCVTKKSDV
jgi:molybdopterin/thiamine biosynthesis adenylyltransferase